MAWKYCEKYCKMNDIKIEYSNIVKPRKSLINTKKNITWRQDGQLLFEKYGINNQFILSQKMFLTPNYAEEKKI